MPSFQKIERLHLPARQMFDVVADVEAYPEFLPLCESLALDKMICNEKGEISELIATMTVAYKIVRQSYTSRVSLNRAKNEIRVQHLEGPFKILENRWRFRDLNERESETFFYINYEFRSRALQGLMGGMFDRAFQQFSTAFTERAKSLYMPA